MGAGHLCLAGDRAAKGQQQQGIIFCACVQQFSHWCYITLCSETLYSGDYVHAGEHMYMVCAGAVNPEVWPMQSYGHVQVATMWPCTRSAGRIHCNFTLFTSRGEYIDRVP